MSDQSPEAKALLEAAADLRISNASPQQKDEAVKNAASAYAAAMRPIRSWNTSLSSWTNLIHRRRIPVYNNRFNAMDLRPYPSIADEYEDITLSMCSSCRKVFDKPQSHWCG